MYFQMCNKDIPKLLPNRRYFPWEIPAVMDEQTTWSFKFPDASLTNSKVAAQPRQKKLATTQPPKRAVR